MLFFISQIWHQFNSVHCLRFSSSKLIFWYSVTEKSFLFVGIKFRGFQKNTFSWVLEIIQFVVSVYMCTLVLFQLNHKIDKNQCPTKYNIMDFTAKWHPYYKPISTGELTRPKKFIMPPPNNTVDVTKNAYCKEKSQRCIEPVMSAAVTLIWHFQ